MVSLFQLQADLVDSKVDKAVSQAINQVVEQIVSLRQEVHTEIGGLRHEMHHEISGLRHEMHREIGGLRKEMHAGFSGLETRMVAVETKLGMRQEWQSGFRTRFLDYGFRVAWLLLGAAIFYTLNTHLSALKPLLH